MSSQKEAEHLANTAPVEESEGPPAYETASPGPSAAAAAQPRDDNASPENAGESSKAPDSAHPTAEAPFDFPSSDAPLPSYSEASSSSQAPITIPQTNPAPTAPFLNAYAPSLLSYGITQEAWSSFLDTVSAFLTAKVSGRAVSHAGDMAKKIGEHPTSFIKNVVSHTKKVGKEIGDNAKRGNIIGAAFGVIGGAITIPVTAALGATGTIVTLPIHTIAVVTRKPKTPAQRAVAYITVANKDWFNKRGLHASLVNTEQLSEVVGTSVKDLLKGASEGKGSEAEGPLGALKNHIAHLEIQPPGIVDLGADTIWLVLVRIEATP
ncbi:hypothetical protein FZEAL_3487 [Fusarium zealandicum]|uniref:Uncharacterized protein n=1 Tax=Fusarium zealandicum TaxID=1053134 RepID=A0A8H4UNQ9_9HYPO|nr:hypothetical protein FZEAL_3487 [Fusarium zealandicum]